MEEFLVNPCPWERPESSMLKDEVEAVVSRIYEFTLDCFFVGQLCRGSQDPGSRLSLSGSGA